MTSRRAIVLLAASVVVLSLSGLILVGQLRAQEPGAGVAAGPGAAPPTMGAPGGGGPPTMGGPGGAGPPGMAGGPPGMAGGPPGMGGAPGGMGPGAGMPGMMGAPGARRGAPLQWSESPMPPERTMTYEEFVRKHNLKPVKIPKPLLEDEKGNPIKRTANAWWQLHRIYTEGPEPRDGVPGKFIVSQAEREYEAKQAELLAVARLYIKGLKCFRGYVTGPVAPRPENVPNDSLRAMAAAGALFGVVVWPKESAVKAFSAQVNRTFARLDQLGWSGADRTRVWVTTWEKGAWGRRSYLLWSGAAALWQQLWASTEVRVRLSTTDGVIVADVTGPLNINTQDVTFALLNPPELPRLDTLEALLTPGRLRTFKGGELPAVRNGWAQGLSLAADVDVLRRLNGAEIIVQGGVAPQPPQGELVPASKADPVKIVERHQNLFVRAGSHGTVQAQGTYAPLRAQLVSASALMAVSGGRAGAAISAAGGAPAAGGGGGMMGPSGAPGMMGAPGGGPPGMGGAPGPGMMGPVGPGYHPQVPPTAAMMPGL